jgi:hypothetical protein
MTNQYLPPEMVSILNMLDDQIRMLDDRLADRDDDSEFRQDEELAAAARAGDLGEDWKAIQKRIDAGKTTVESVFNGSDDSAEAKALRAMSQKNMARLREQWDEQDMADPDNENPSPVAQINAILQESQQRLEELKGRYW